MKGDRRRVTRWGDPSMETFTALASKNSSFGPKFRRNQGGLKSRMMAIGIIGQEFSRLCFEDDMFKQVKGHTFFADTDALEKIINDNDNDSEWSGKVIFPPNNMNENGCFGCVSSRKVLTGWTGHRTWTFTGLRKKLAFRRKPGKQMGEKGHKVSYWQTGVSKFVQRVFGLSCEVH